MKPNYQLVNLENQVFGKLLIKSRGPKSNDGKSQWVCVCTCPERNEVIVRQKDLLQGKVNSCGCIRREMVVDRNTKHSSSRRGNQTPEYVVWRSMKNRCNSDDPRVAANYKNLGIKVCERWQSFSNFLEDMGNRPSPMHTLDRIDGSDGGTLGYTKENCRWATYKEQANNRRSTKLVEMNGKSQSLKQWCEELNLSYGTILARVYQHGWGYERALTTPVRTINRHIENYVESKNSKEPSSEGSKSPEITG